MIANKFKILLPKTTDQEINIPIEMNWDFLDRSNSIADFEKKTIKDVLNQDKDFEVVRFEHAQDPVTLATDINYEFNFVPTGATISNAVWTPSYVVQGFSPYEIYYYEKPFEKSFFKLDLYDTINQSGQTNYVSLILPVQQGLTTAATVGYKTELIKTPIMKLDFLGDMEGFFIYWLKKRDFLNISTFYMTAKFFDAKTGVFIKMMNTPQSNFTGVNKFNFNQNLFFYYKVVLDYSNYTYKVYDISTGFDVEVGYSSNPIKWYEYINP